MPVALVCRGCCCGTTKHPHVDPGAQVAALEAVAEVIVTRCLGSCRRSNVIAVVDPDSGEQTWFGGVLEPEQTAAVAGWLAGERARPEAHVFDPPPTDAFRALLRARVGRPAGRPS